MMGKVLNGMDNIMIDAIDVLFEWVDVMIKFMIIVMIVIVIIVMIITIVTIIVNIEIVKMVDEGWHRYRCDDDIMIYIMIIMRLIVQF